MRLLAIETSCDETAVAVVEATEHGAGTTTFTVLGNALLSQIDIHKEYGGVFPMLAKREHAKNLIPLLEAALSDAGMITRNAQVVHEGMPERIQGILEREPELHTQLIEFVFSIERPAVDAIAVTAGPGLEPALWVGVNLARALSTIWDIPCVSVNHMEGHVITALAQDTGTSSSFIVPSPSLPLLSLLISGGHTELVLMRTWLAYELMGQTRDDAVGEAYDKVARMLGLSYPGGPEVSRLAERARARGGENPVMLPRPMLSDPACDFSFSGLKTAVLYMVKDAELTELEKENIAFAFEDAAADVLYAKSSRALTQSGARMIALGGGVSANTHIRRVFRERLQEDHPEVTLCIPAATLTTDNALMIAMAGYYRAKEGHYSTPEMLRADGNRALASEGQSRVHLV